MSREAMADVDDDYDYDDFSSYDRTMQTRYVSSRKLWSRRRRVKSLSDLRPGDHVARYRDRGYYHHSIVIELGDAQGSRIKVIDYSGGRLTYVPPFVKGQGRVRERWVTFYDVKKLVLFEYPPEVSFSREQVLARARSRLGECRYNLFTNNCEHFARWCWCDDSRSLQVDRLKAVARRVGVSLALTLLGLAPLVNS